MRIACAMFVKTPGLSPVKTRLAKGIGEDAATEIYLACAEYIRTSLLHTQSLLARNHVSFDAMYAVAEDTNEAAAFWSDLPNIKQGAGALGERLHRVYSELSRSYDMVILIGADCPQLDATHIDAALKVLSRKDVVFGRSSDGGFYLFATRVENVTARSFLDVAYSSALTLQQLKANLEDEGFSVDDCTLAVLTDLDESTDLAPCIRELRVFGKS